MQKTGQLDDNAEQDRVGTLPVYGTLRSVCAGLLAKVAGWVYQKAGGDDSGRDQIHRLPRLMPAIAR